MKVLPLCFGAALALAGCSRTPPLERTVSAASTSALSHWRDGMEDDLTPAQWKDFDATLQEIQYQLIADGTMHDSDAREAAVRAGIDGHTVRDVMRLGYELKLARLDTEARQIVEFLGKNAAIKPVSAQAATQLAGMHDTQTALLQSVDGEMELTSQKLDLLLQRPHAPLKPHSPPP